MFLIHKRELFAKIIDNTVWPWLNQKEKAGQVSPHKERKHFESVQLKGLQSVITNIQTQVLCQK